MQNKPLTAKQQYWLDHINSAQDQNLSLSDYAREHNISLTSLYKWRWYLSNKSYLNKPNTSAFVKIVPSRMVESKSAPVIAVLPNGVKLEFPTLTVDMLAMLQQC